jgi:sugar transferase (PEP-CTERM/EpsH1 system associated)
MFRYGEPFAALGVPLLVDLVDVDSQKWWQLSQTERGLRRWLYRVESRRLRKLESHIAANYPVSVVSRRERELLHEVCPSASVHVVANGVELEYFAGIRPSESVTKAAPTCLFLGVLNYTPNVQGVLWFAENVWPSLKAQLPQARWLIVGKSPVRQVEALARMPGVSVHANVPDVRPWLEQAHVAIAPLLVARGLQNKVLEAMAAGRSVVATRTALDGLDTCEPPPALAADGPQQWLAALARLLGDDSYRWPLEEKSRRYVERHYDYRTCMAPFLPLLGLETTDAAYHPAAERQVLAES